MHCDVCVCFFVCVCVWLWISDSYYLLVLVLRPNLILWREQSNRTNLFEKDVSFCSVEHCVENESNTIFSFCLAFYVTQIVNETEWSKYKAVPNAWRNTSHSDSMSISDTVQNTDENDNNKTALEIDF